MPAHGNQHTAWANPYEEPVTRVSDWTAKEIATISAKLDKQLGPEYISARAGPGGAKVHYLTAEKCITLANEVFGFNGWSSSIQNIQVDYADENPQSQRVSIGLSVIVRVTLRDGTFHEDVGYGSIENAKSKGMAFEKAKKEGTTDGLKRALRSFGNVLGNCIYDQDYVKQVIKLKAQPVKRFGEHNLHRHADFIVAKDETESEVAAGDGSANKVKVELNETFDDYLGELDEADFCVTGEEQPDELGVPLGAAVESSKRSASVAPAAPPQDYRRQFGRTQSAGNTIRPPQTPSTAEPRVVQQASTNGPRQGPGTTAASSNAVPAQPVAFFSAKAVKSQTGPGMQGNAAGVLNAGNGPQLFNPKAESPSIRKTPGIDHSSSKPVSRTGQHVPPVATATDLESVTAAPSHLGRPSLNAVPSPATAAAGGGGLGSGGATSRTNVINPSLDQVRRIGAPSSLGSPLGNRGSYKPPSMKRAAPGDGNVNNSMMGANMPRPALADISTNVANVDVVVGDGLDTKRQKMT